MPAKVTRQHFIAKAMSKHGTKYDYTKTIYINNRTPVTITCPIHGDFQQKADSHAQGFGCGKCGKTGTFSYEELIAEFNIVHNHKYAYVKCTKLTKTTNIGIICPLHNLFYQQIANHKLGHACPQCAKSGFDGSKPAVLYYLSINNGAAYKIGITNRTIQDRFKTELHKITVLKYWEYSVGKDARFKEQAIIIANKKYKYKGPALLLNGNSELFSIDILKLNKDT